MKIFKKMLRLNDVRNGKMTKLYLDCTSTTESWVSGVNLIDEISECLVLTLALLTLKMRTRPDTRLPRSRVDGQEQ